MSQAIMVATTAVILLLVTGQTVLMVVTAATGRQQDFDSVRSGDSGMKSLNIELIKLSILNKLGMQQPPEFGDQLPLIVHLQKYKNNSGSSTATLPQFQHGSYRLNSTGNSTINNYNSDDDDDYHVQTQKLIAFAQPHPTMQNLQGHYPLYFTFSDQTRHYRITKAILWVYKRLLDVIIDNSVVIIDVYKINSNNLQQSLVSSIKRVLNTNEPGWVPIELQRNMSDWFKTMDRAKNLTLVVHAYYLNKNTTHNKMPYITDANKGDENMTEIPYLEVHTHRGYRNRREAWDIKSPTCDNRTKAQPQSRCCRYPVRIKFRDFGWDWIIMPRSFTYYYCLRDSNTAECSLSQGLQNSTIGQCCVPRKTSNITLLYVDSSGIMNSTVIPDIITDVCG
ncbi:growth/differentiation factor 8-like isoform X2 [Rhopalosiphum padi]|nr:growth/differentiation factor 8-like isoform X2 [Rhopalosiphum padi]XP_060842315.1 growth/differentiation factor 8-like isoform X2 [Rhopalosiphum padi]